MTAPASATATTAALLVLVFGLALVARFLFEQGLPVGDRDLIIVGMDFREGEEAVAVAAVIDERRLERRFDARDLGEVDVTAKLLAVGALEVEFLDAIAAHNDHPGLFRMGRVDEHFVGHGSISLDRRQSGTRATMTAQVQGRRSDWCGRIGPRLAAAIRKAPKQAAPSRGTRESGGARMACAASAA